MYFTIYRNAAGQYYWNLKSANHQIIANGETYHNRADCAAAVGLVMATNSSTPFYDGTK